MASARGAGEPAWWDVRRTEGKRVMVTGGTTGIGLAIARLLASRGARVFVLGRNAGDLNKAMEAIRGEDGEAHGTTADLSDAAEVRRAFDEADLALGGVDVLVNNAAIPGDELEELEDIDHAVRTSVFGYIACAREAVERMRGHGGHIVNVGSMSADPREPDGATCVATRAAIRGFSESLREAVAREGIRVTLVEPGKVDAELVSELGEEEKRERIERMETHWPEDVAVCVCFALTQPHRCDVVRIEVRPHPQVI
ncbi:MAG TPA: SDR family oxidoreductase [Longimicrobium sp.]|nr:SDR family oxidoreductase [Longimicrobium sp.]